MSKGEDGGRRRPSGSRRGARRGGGTAAGFDDPARARHGLRAFRRTGLAAAVVAASCWGLAVAGGGRAAADTPAAWVAGDATATSQAITVHPSTAGLGYDVTLATSIADYQANLGQAESKTFDGGAIVLAATTTQCNGSAPVVSQSQLPQPVIVESANGNTSQSRTLASGYNGSGPGAGVEQASATTQPQGSAVTKLSDFDVPGGLDVAGSQSSAFAQQVAGTVRQATATADVGQVTLAGGLVSLNGLHWQATQETGPGGTVTQATGAFTLSSVTVAGTTLPVSTDNVAQVFDTVNTALGPSGFHLGPVPALEQNSADGSAAVPPLAIGIDSSALGAQVVGPLLGSADTLRQALDQVLLGVSCQIGTPLTVRDIALGALAGGGGIDLELGGVRAVSDGTTFANPFGTSLGLSAGPAGSIGTGAGATPASVGTGTFTPGSAAVPGTPAGVGAAPGSGAPAAGPAGQPAQVLGGVRGVLHCLTTSPFGHPGCSGGGAAVPIGLAGLAAVVGMGAADFARARRYRRVVPDGAPA
jgi:hypothetical protein